MDKQPKKHTNKELADELQRFQDWRTGKDERTMDEAGIVPRQLTAMIDLSIERLGDYHIDTPRKQK